MEDPTLISGLLASARDQLVAHSDRFPDAADLDLLADAAEMTATALDRTQAFFGPAAPLCGALTLHAWSRGAAIGLRCERPGREDHYLYLAANPDGRNGRSELLVHAGANGDPAADEVICCAAVPSDDERPASQVTVELPREGQLQLGPIAAAAIVVNAYGERALEIAVRGRKAAFDAYWREVERLLGGRGRASQRPAA
jgi:hypothetical protein